mmetsp:Transcript_88054/g.273680  ORF Transcript_88054/g.273680 Transcript_88054/m.273680 type:complete len:278 (-) Transcript_88054:223-1056(-)
MPSLKEQPQQQTPAMLANVCNGIVRSPQFPSARNSVLERNRCTPRAAPTRSTHVVIALRHRAELSRGNSAVGLEEDGILRVDVPVLHGHWINIVHGVVGVIQSIVGLATLRCQDRVAEVMVAPNRLADVESIAMLQNCPGEVKLAARPSCGLLLLFAIAMQRSVEYAHTHWIHHQEHGLDVGSHVARSRGAHHCHSLGEESPEGRHPVTLREWTSHRSVHEDDVRVVALPRFVQANLVGAHVEALVLPVQVPNLRMKRDRHSWAMWRRVNNQHVDML